MDISRLSPIVERFFDVLLFTDEKSTRTRMTPSSLHQMNHRLAHWSNLDNPNQENLMTYNSLLDCYQSSGGKGK